MVGRTIFPVNALSWFNDFVNFMQCLATLGRT
jgi:hypothetical protein